MQRILEGEQAEMEKEMTKHYGKVKNLGRAAIEALFGEELAVRNERNVLVEHIELVEPFIAH